MALCCARWHLPQCSTMARVFSEQSKCEVSAEVFQYHRCHATNDATQTMPLLLRSWQFLQHTPTPYQGRSSQVGIEEARHTWHGAWS